MRIRGPVVLYQPREQGYVMPLGLLQLGSALRGQPVEIVDGRLDLAPEARVAGLAREALLLGVTVPAGGYRFDSLYAADRQARERAGELVEAHAARK